MQNPLGADKEKKIMIPNWDFWEMKWADVVFVSNINNFGGPYTVDIIRKAHELGKFVHFDTDDLLTELYPEHRLFKVYTDHQLSEMTKAMYYNSHMVTVTQTKFAELIKPYVRGVIGICRNAIDFSLPCWNVPKSKSKPVRIGWAGGIHHRPDVKVFAGVPHLVNQKVGKENVIWDFYGHPPPNQPKEEAWQIEAWNEYKQSLLKGMSGKPNYRIHDALPPGEYGVFYAHMDIAVAPLADNNFNRSKSEIKLAECCAYNVPLVANDIGCYSDVLRSGKNGYLIRPNASPSEWVTVLSKLIKDKQHRETLGAELGKYKPFYDINNVVWDRLNLYAEVFTRKGWKFSD